MEYATHIVTEIEYYGVDTTFTLSKRIDETQDENETEEQLKVYGNELVKAVKVQGDYVANKNIGNALWNALHLLYAYYPNWNLIDIVRLLIATGIDTRIVIVGGLER